MLPLVLDVSRLRLLLLGGGEAALRRLQLLEEAGARDVAVFAAAPTAQLAAAAGARLRRRWPSAEELAAAQLVFIVGIPAPHCEGLARAAREAGAIVHIEDLPLLSDAHAPAVLRRGDLTIAVSTGGASPTLAVQIKQFLARLFGPEWQARLEQMSARRRSWRAAGADAATIAQWTEEWLGREGWLDGATPPRPRRAGRRWFVRTEGGAKLASACSAPVLGREGPRPAEHGV
ncbi:MAG TPA: NAD(P)-dependent oxidoreductase [Stellaceae bacterium]|nr:NAD(P)-dependent oxidoreductase [Stellaceae bacterium]